MLFGEYVVYYKIVCFEGVVLWYFFDVYCVVLQIILEEFKDEDLCDFIEWFGEFVCQVDLSLFDEWEELIVGVDNGCFDLYVFDELIVLFVFKWFMSNICVFCILVCNELFCWVQFVVREDVDVFVEFDLVFGVEVWLDVFDGYFVDYDEILIGVDVCSLKLLIFMEGLIVWIVWQIFDDFVGDYDWGIFVMVDFVVLDEVGQVVVMVIGVDWLQFRFVLL